jgi:hypothetical protein
LSPKQDTLTIKRSARRRDHACRIISAIAMMMAMPRWARLRMPKRSTSRKFDDPIPLAKGKELVTLRDAALYVTKLPQAEHDAEEWQTAMEALLPVAESDGPTIFARIGMMRALNRRKPEPAPAPRRKRTKAYQIIE